MYVCYCVKKKPILFLSVQRPECGNFYGALPHHISNCSLKAQLWIKTMMLCGVKGSIWEMQERPILTCQCCVWVFCSAFNSDQKVIASDNATGTSTLHVDKVN